MDYAGILTILRCSDAEIHSLFRCGSRVYGTATPASDEDFVAVMTRRDGGRDLVFGDRINVITYGQQGFREALDHQSVLALECLFAPGEHRLKAPAPAFQFTLDRKKLAESATSRSESDFKKAGKRFADEPEASKKKLFHSLRVPMFALQVARTGAIRDFGEAAPLWREIAASAATEWEPYEARYAALREGMCGELAKLAAGRKGARR